ncbi:MAG: four helix bundle protein [Candidatus Thorarchaeota archaeon]
MSHGYSNLLVWKKAYNQTLKIYNFTKSFPKNETYGIISQMRRTSSSIIANIAEGYGKRNLSEYLYFISIAISSCNELEVFLLLSKDLHYLDKKDFNCLIDSHVEITKMLLGLRKALEKKKST